MCHQSWLRLSRGAGWSRPWLMTFRHFPSHFINNHNSSRIIITETYPGFPSVWKMMNETRAMMNCDKKKRARGSDLFYLFSPSAADRNTGKCVHCASLPHSSSLFLAGCILSNLAISLISVLMWQMHSTDDSNPAKELNAKGVVSWWSDCPAMVRAISRLPSRWFTG